MLGEGAKTIGFSPVWREEKSADRRLHSLYVLRARCQTAFVSDVAARILIKSGRNAKGFILRLGHVQMQVVFSFNSVMVQKCLLEFLISDSFLIQLSTLNMFKGAE